MKSATPRKTPVSDDETEHDAGRLDDLLAVRPLHALQLGPAAAQETCDAGERRAALLDVRRRAEGGVGRGVHRGSSAERSRAEVVVIVGEDGFEVLGDRRGAGAAGACGQRRSRPRRRGAALRRRADGFAPWHERLARLPVAGVPPAPAAVLSQRDAIRVVALALIRLVIAALALLACEGDSDPYVSAGH